MLTQDRPIIVGDAPTDRNHEFLFVEGDRIVGRVYADCVVCAWQVGHPRFPNALVASWCRDGGRPLEVSPVECIIKKLSQKADELVGLGIRHGLG